MSTTDTSGWMPHTHRTLTPPPPPTMDDTVPAMQAVGADLWEVTHDEGIPLVDRVDTHGDLICQQIAAQLGTTPQRAAADPARRLAALDDWIDEANEELLTRLIRVARGEAVRPSDVRPPHGPGETAQLYRAVSGTA